MNYLEFRRGKGLAGSGPQPPVAVSDTPATCPMCKASITIYWVPEAGYQTSCPDCCAAVTVMPHGAPNGN